jgi:putative transposase
MPRKPRFILPGIPQHVIQRGNNREPCFFAEQDYHRYIDELRRSAEKCACRIHEGGVGPAQRFDCLVPSAGK